MMDAEANQNATNCWKIENSSSDNNGGWTMVKEKNPLMNDVILDTFFSFLKGNELLMCRLVNKKWLTISEKYFKKESRLKMSVKNKDMISTSRENLLTLNELFPDSDMDPLNCFTAVAFKGKIEESILTDFFKSVKGRQTKDVLFYNIRIYKGSKRLDKFNISGLLRAKDLTSFQVIINEKDDDFWESASEPTSVMVKSNCIKSCKIVVLNKCLVVVNEQISPEYLSFIRVDLMKKNGDGLILIRYLNQLVDFSKARIVHLNMHRKILIDMSDPKISLEELKISETELVKWRDSSWTIKDLYLKVFKFEIRNKMNVNLLDIRDWKALNLIAIPNTVEKLIIRNCLNDTSDPSFILQEKSDAPNTLSQFPNLQYLKLYEMFYVLPMFYNCENLLDLVLQSTPNPKYKLNVNNIPKNVQCVSLECVEFTSNIGVRDLNTLVLRGFSLSNVKDCLEKLRPKYLVLDCPFPRNNIKPLKSEQSGPMSNEEWKNFFDHTRESVVRKHLSIKEWKEFLLLTRRVGVEYVVVGPLNDFSLLTDTVNLLKQQMGQYCIFSNQNNSIKSITYWKFKQFKQFRKVNSKKNSDHDLLADI